MGWLPGLCESHKSFERKTVLGNSCIVTPIHLSTRRHHQRSRYCKTLQTLFGTGDGTVESAPRRRGHSRGSRGDGPIVRAKRQIQQARKSHPMPRRVGQGKVRGNFTGPRSVLGSRKIPGDVENAHKEESNQQNTQRSKNCPAHFSAVCLPALEGAQDTYSQHTSRHCQQE